jgi:hypothetical protein
MNYRLRAVYREGVFVPSDTCELPDETEVELLVQVPGIVPPAVSEPGERALVINRLVQRMLENPIPYGAARYSREELHERS